MSQVDKEKEIISVTDYHNANDIVKNMQENDSQFKLGILFDPNVNLS